jgi:hypothetical protein
MHACQHQKGEEALVGGTAAGSDGSLNFYMSSNMQQLMLKTVITSTPMIII